MHEEFVERYGLQQFDGLYTWYASQSAAAQPEQAALAALFCKAALQTPWASDLINYLVQRVWSPDALGVLAIYDGRTCRWVPASHSRESVTLDIPTLQPTTVKSPGLIVTVINLSEVLRW